MPLYTKFYENFFALNMTVNHTENHIKNRAILNIFKNNNLHYVKCLFIHSSVMPVLTVVSGNQIFFNYEKKKLPTVFYIFICRIIEKKNFALSTARFKM